MASVNEQIAEEIRRHSIALIRFEAGEKKKILRMLNRLLADIAGQIQDSGIGGSSYKKRRFDLLFRDVERTIAERFMEIGEKMNGTISGLEKVEMEWAAKTLNRVLAVDLFVMPPMTSGQISAAASEILIQGATSREWWSRQSEKLLNGFKDQMRMGWLHGETNDQLLKRLVGGTDIDGNAIFDLAKGTRRGAEATIRTSVQAIASDARMRLYRENDDIIKGIVWVSTLDNRTTVACASFDGLAWDLDGNPIGHDKVFTPPPLHWNCRSSTAPLLKSFRELGIDKNEIPPSTRASMDGQVPEKIGFDRWLKRKDAEDPDFVDEQFGVGRAKLWRSGKIGLLEMTDQRGRELTLEELKK